jgi:hypothetical protein
VNVAIEAAFHVGRRGAACRQRKHRAFAFEDAVGINPVSAIGPSHREHPIDPALENARQTEPPQWKLPDHQVAPFDLLDLVLDLLGKSVGFGRVQLLELLLEIIRILGRQEVAPSRHRVELHGMEIRCLDLVACRGQRIDRSPEHGAVETLMLGMREDDEDFH